MEPTNMEKVIEEHRQNLEKLTVKQLLTDYATPLNITGRHDMKKADLIQAILMVYASDKPEVFVKEDKKIEAPTKTNEDVDEETRMKNKKLYIENAQIGTIVAFKLPGMKVKSAKIIKKSTKNRKFKVETAYGMQHVITYDDILWVKTNRRWPKGVYTLLKGIEE